MVNYEDCFEYQINKSVNSIFKAKLTIETTKGIHKIKAFLGFQSFSNSRSHIS